MHCRNCGNEVLPNAEFCVRCGSRPLSGANYCQHCGAPTAPQQEMCVKCGMRLVHSEAAAGNVSERNKTTAAILCGLQLLGFGGIHRFYTGHIGIGIVQLLTWGGCFIWQLVDFIAIMEGRFRDIDGKIIK